MQQKYVWKVVLGLWLLTTPVQAQEFLLEESLVPNVPLFRLTYTWGDFLMENSCLTDFNRLEDLAVLSEEQNGLRDKMQTYCAGKITVWDNLLLLFRQNKKALLIDKVSKENTSFIKYVKVLPYYLFNIHNQHPQGEGLSAKLDRIQNAIQNKNPEQVILFMQALSPNEQLFFMPLFNEANSLIDFKKILSESEETND